MSTRECRTLGEAGSGQAMAEPPTTTLPQVGAGGPGGLLATKLFLPRPQPGFVARPRLLERPEEGLAPGLVLVCAPAGFGKTALIADWAQTGRRPVAWLSLDQGDNDPARFWRHVVAALDRLRPGIAERVVGLLGPPAPPSFEGLVTALINELAAESGQVLLILDDYHLIDAQPVHASLEFLLEHRPPGLRLVLTSRVDPPLPLARLRVRGQLAELRAAQLRFHGRGGRRGAGRDGRVRDTPARCCRGGLGHPHRRVAGRAAAGRPVAAGAARLLSRRFEAFWAGPAFAVPTRP
jgi:hypothetical protein